MTDQALVKKIKEGDIAAINRMVETYQDIIFRICYGFVRNEEDANDLSQEVFIKAYRSINKFQGDSKLSSWLYRIAVNLSLNHIRDTNKRNVFQRIGEMVKQDDDNPSGNYDPVAGESYSPDNQVSREEQTAAVNQALAKLPEKQRTAFTLHKYDELRYEEIAEVMNTSISSVESLMHRAKKNLQATLLTFYQKNIE